MQPVTRDSVVLKTAIAKVRFIKHFCQECLGCATLAEFCLITRGKSEFGPRQREWYYAFGPRYKESGI